jgi:hypothetical protein
MAHAANALVLGTAPRQANPLIAELTKLSPPTEDREGFPTIISSNRAACE